MVPSLLSYICSTHGVKAIDQSTLGRHEGDGDQEPVHHLASAFRFLMMVRTLRKYETRDTIHSYPSPVCGVSMLIPKTSLLLQDCHLRATMRREICVHGLLA